MLIAIVGKVAIGNNLKGWLMRRNLQFTLYNSDIIIDLFGTIFINNREGVFYSTKVGN